MMPMVQWKRNVWLLLALMYLIVHVKKVTLDCFVKSVLCHTSELILKACATNVHVTRRFLMDLVNLVSSRLCQMRYGALCTQIMTLMMQLGCYG